MSTVLQQILTWSQTRPEWQRDALRRLLIKGELGAEDYDQLAELCKHKHGIQRTEGSPRLVRVLRAEHLPSPEKHLAPVRLLALSELTGVNALAEDQTLSFEPEGITVVYGDNGSGKSGYGRVLRALCRSRARDRKAIHPNVYRENSPTLSVKALIRVGDQDQQIFWERGSESPSQMSSISIFDADAAYCYVEDKNDVAFMPFGLDLFDRLCSVCGEVETRLRAELEPLKQYPDYSDLQGDHAVGQFISTINHKSSVTTLDELAVFTDEDAARLKAVEAEIATLGTNDPVKQARDLRNKASRYLKVDDTLKTLEASLGEGKIEEIKKAIKARNTAVKTAEAASRDLTSSGILPGTGLKIWQELWSSARRFSEQFAYPDQPFPFVEDGAQCPLCQQNLDGTAKQRLERFDAFVRNDVQTRATLATEAAKTLLDAIAKIQPKDAIDETALNEICDDENAFGELIFTFIDGAVQTQKAAAKLNANIDYPIPQLPASPRIKFIELITGLQKEAGTLEKVKPDEKLKELQDEVGLLKATKLLTKKKQAVVDDIERHKQIAKYENCLREVNTTGISSKSGRLTEKVVTSSLCTHFGQELRKLDPYAFRVSLEKSHTQRGTAYHQVTLKCHGEAKVQDILSDGEFRCVALAGFMTELATASHKAPIVFDDPVSSLDHRWRDQVAKRLVDEAHSRQVIVFTHDLVFFLMLQEHAEALDVKHSTRHLERGADHAGICKDGPPWQGKNVGKRIGELKQRHQQAEAVYNMHGEGLYRPVAAGIYGLLREAWERAVEEVLFNQVVVRFRRGIETNRLKKVLGDVSEDDYQAIDAGMTRCSMFMVGHDQATEVNQPVPRPNDLKADIEALATWVKKVNKRR